MRSMNSALALGMMTALSNAAPFFEPWAVEAPASKHRNSKLPAAKPAKKKARKAQAAARRGNRK